MLIAPAVNQHVQNVSFIIDRPPKSHAPVTDLHHHLVEVPATGGVGASSLEVGGDCGAEPDRPATDRLIADLKTALAEQFLDIAQAEREAEI